MVMHCNDKTHIITVIIVENTHGTLGLDLLGLCLNPLAIYLRMEFEFP